VVLIDHAAEHSPALHRRGQRHDDPLVMIGWLLPPGLVAAWVRRNCRQVVRLRCGADGIRSRFRIRRTVGRRGRRGADLNPYPLGGAEKVLS